MLAQAARRRSQRDASRRLSRAASQIYPPWLCPALSRGNSSLSPIARDSDSRTAQQRPRTVASSHSRTLATSVEAISQIKASPVFDQISQDDLSRARGSNSSSPLLQWKDSKPLIFRTETAAVPRLNYLNGIGGDPAELHSNLHASLRVGRLDRAAALLRRIRDIYNPNVPELIEANNFYLLEVMERVIAKQPGYTINTMNSWFENELREQDIQPNAVTYTCMLRAAIAVAQGGKRERLVRRYMWFAQQSGVLDEVLTNAAWSDDEFAVLADVRPDLIGMPEAEVAEVAEPVPGEHAGLRAQAEPQPARADYIPELRAVRQKGLGLETVKCALSIFMDKKELAKNLPYPHDLTGYTDEEKDFMYARMRQDRLEEDSVAASIERWRQEHENMQKMGITSALQTKPMAAQMWQWYIEMLPLFKQELNAVQKAYEEENPDIEDELMVTGPFLEAFTPEKLAATSLIVTLAAFGSPDHYNGIKVSTIAMAIGKQLAMEHSLMVASQGTQPKPSAYKTISPRRLRSLIRNAKPTDLNQTVDSNQTVDPNQTENPNQATPSEDTTAGGQMSKSLGLEWAPIIKAKIGALCLAKILEATKVPVTREEKETRKQLSSTEPAFHHATVYVGGKKTGMIQLHPDILEKLRKEPLRGSFGTKYPMVVEPLPWTGYRRGGYLRYPEAIIKEKRQDDSQRIYAQAAIERGDMDQVLAGLSVLGKTAWKVNRDVFKVVVDVWNTGEPVGGIAPENPKLDYPPEPGPDAEKKEYALWLTEKTRIDNERSGYHSQRCFQNFQLEVARSYKDEIFYFPHNMDFRGRAYPIPALLNHLGADLARGLLTFGKGRQLGTVGLTWLKIHLANVFGYDKASLKDREAFAMEHIEDIYDSCQNPLTGRQWWLKGEDPWQCLATCFELKHALDSPNPAQYVSHLPVHQDGTCNGLQHYAALGGDKAGAAQVNLEPGDKPSDIYSAVAALVQTYIAEDAKQGDGFALLLDGKISRKVVKQTVMTNVYGVTFTGARLQVIKQLVDLIPDEEKKRDMFPIGGYVAKLIFKALGHMFNGAQEIQDWLGACANRISTALTPEQIDMLEAQVNKGAEGEGESADSRYKARKRTKKDTLSKKDIISQFRATIVWTTPLKMPVVQPYRQTKSREISTVLQCLSIVQPKFTDTVDKRKQLQAFPPNFIHSLDATHMLLSALKCDEIGLSFASVHDSFWTHAADIPIMNRVLRDAFVRMHSEDIVGRLHEEFSIRYKDCLYLATVPRSSPLGKRIFALRRSRHSSQTLIGELLRERERQRLLNSADEAERERGAAMVTPASLCETARAEEEAAAEAEDGGSGGDASARLDLHADGELRVVRLGDTPQNAASAVSAKHISATKETNKAAVMEDSNTAEDSAAVDEMDDEQDMFESILGEHHPSEEELEDEDEYEEQQPQKKKKKTENVVKFWMPIEFPAVPKKGDFDVRRLKESTYFFS